MIWQNISIRYILFAVIATIANLGSQRIILGIDDTRYFFVGAIAIGTIVGLSIKYILDKRWIFRDMSAGLKAHGRKFSLYMFMGVFTTVIFWFLETVFWLIWKTDFMREIGAIVGLSIGYYVKFNLDKRYVFTPTVKSRET
jgi:putative flippase GtrA